MSFLVSISHRFSACLAYLFVAAAISGILACGSYDQPSTEIGSASFQVVWVGAPLHRTERALAAASIDCAAAGVITVAVEVNDASLRNLTSDEFACTAGEGTVSGIPAGHGRIFVVSGLDGDGKTLYRGEVTGVNIEADKNTIVEDPIVLEPVASLPEPPTQVAVVQSSGDSINVTWTASVSEGVEGYNVYYGYSAGSIDQKANNVLISALIDDQWQFETIGLDKGVTIFIAVAAVDGYSRESVTSTAASTAIIPRPPPPPNPSEILESQYPLVFPEAIAISRDGLRAYVTNSVNDVVSLVDLTTSSILGNILVGDNPVDIVANPVDDQVYCVNKYSNTVTIIDSTISDPNQAIIGIFETASLPVRAIVSPDGEYLFVSCIGAGADSVTVIDLRPFWSPRRSKKMVITFPDGTTMGINVEIDESPITVGGDPQGMAISNGKLYVANEWDNNLSVIDIDPESQTQWQTLGYTIPVGNTPKDLAANPDGGKIYVANWGEETISVINSATDQEVKKITVGDNPERMATWENILYISQSGDSSVAMINMSTDEVLQSFGVGQLPMGIAATPDGETLYIVNSGSESISIREY